MECPPEPDIKAYSSPTVVEDDDSAQGENDRGNDSEEEFQDTKGTKLSETFYDASQDKDTLRKQPVTVEFDLKEDVSRSASTSNMVDDDEDKHIPLAAEFHKWHCG